MRYLVILALAFLCLASCDNDTDVPPKLETDETDVPLNIHVHNATGVIHQVDVEFDNGFKTLKIGEDGRFQLHFSARDPSYTYDVTVYDGSQEKKCSFTIGGVSNQVNTVGQGRCIATTPENSACTVKARTFGPSCQVELTISE